MSSLIYTEFEIGLDIDTARPTDAEVAALAYQLWKDRGCPIGSPDEDWFLAEAILMSHQRVTHRAI